MSEANPNIFERLVRGLGAALARVVYRVEKHGVERIPSGGVLLVPNHVTWVDAIVLQLACPRPIRYMVYETIYRKPLLNPIFRAVGAIPISGTHAREAIRKAADALKAGEVVCIFPEGELSRSGMLLKLKKGFELIARTAEVPVVPVWMDELWGSIFSFSRGRFFSKLPDRFPYRVRIAFGEPIPGDQVNTTMVRDRLMELGEFCYQRRPMLKGHLADACVRGLKRNQFGQAVVDGMDGSSLSRGMVLAVGIAFSKEIRKLCPSDRVAVVLPPGKGAIVTNLAVLLAGKVPVNLNFTAGRAALEASILRGEVRHALTAALVEKKLGDFPWPPDIFRVERILPKLKARILFWRIVVAICPGWLLVRLLGVPRVGDQEEAVLLFTSGSSGEPKGVVLSHRNLLGNVSQFGMMLSLGPGETIMASLPFFHSFGCTVTLWFPMIEDVRTVTYPSPLDVGKNAELIRKYGVTLMISTPTFLRAYLRKVDKEDLASVTMVVTGAEKLPGDLAAAFEEKFGKTVLQGYGLTETSPVTSVNLPDPIAKQGMSVQSSSRSGSVGKLAPGMAAKIRDPETGRDLTLLDTGMLWLAGPNIFEGYLDDEKRTGEVIIDGWFKTGDLARFDEDGFLYIEGRLSRFSKIAGEMVPHETVETQIAQALELSLEGDRQIAVVGVPDEARGEALVLLTSIDLDQSDLRAKLNAAGMPNLWVPKKIKRVETIPLLGTGKLDVRGCKELALES